jgi:hypothetical protein
MSKRVNSDKRRRRRRRKKKEEKNNIQITCGIRCSASSHQCRGQSECFRASMVGMR